MSKKKIMQEILEPGSPIAAKLLAENRDNILDQDNQSINYDDDIKSNISGNQTSSENGEADTLHSLTSFNAKPRQPRQPPIGGKWTIEEDNKLKDIVLGMNAKNWKKISLLLGDTRTAVQCLHRWNKVLKPGLHKGSWTEDEDAIVRAMVLEHGVGGVRWSDIALQLPGRIGKQCRERWFNHLDPNIRKGEWTDEEDSLLYEAQQKFGNRWCDIAKMIPGRTENAVKNRWNSSSMKKWLQDHNIFTPKIDCTTQIEDIITFLDDAALQAQQNSENPIIEVAESHEMKNLSRLPSKTKKRVLVNDEPSLIQPPSSYVGISTGSFINSIPDSLRPPMINTIDVDRSINPRSSGNASTTSVDHSKALFTLLQDMRDAAATYVGSEQPFKYVRHGIDLSQSNSLNSSSAIAFQKIKAELDRYENSPLLTQLQRDQLAAPVPIGLLPFFRYLNESAQRNIIEQVLDRFQRTSFTPRNYCMINTPTNYIGGMDLDLAASQILDSEKTIDSIDPNLFEMYNMEHSTTSRIKGKETKKVKSNLSHQINSSDELVINAAVNVAIQIATGNASTDLLNLLVDESRSAESTRNYSKTKR